MTRRAFAATSTRAHPRAPVSTIVRTLAPVRRLICGPAIAALIPLALSAVKAGAQLPPGVLPQVRYEQRIGARAPAATFTDERGARVSLPAYLGARPLILVLARYECNRFCPGLLDGVVHALQPLAILPGRDYDWAVVSLDPHESPILAGRRKQDYVRRYAHPGGAEGWHFLVGADTSVSALADSVGCRFYHDARTGAWAEPLGAVFLTPGGRVSSYLFGTDFDPETLRQRLAAAASGTLGPPEAGPQVACYPYDPTQSPRGAALMRWIRLSSAANVLLFGGLVGWLLRRERRRLREAAS